MVSALHLLEVLLWFLQIAWGDNQDYSKHINWGLLPHGSCGQAKSLKSRISGGENTNITELPWLVKIYTHYGDNGDEDDILHHRGSALYNGVGVIISDRYVLTDYISIALADPKLAPKKLSVGMGSTDQYAGSYFDGDTPTSFYHDLEGVVTHPNLNVCNHETIKVANDVVLIRMKNKIEFTDHIQPICLPFGIDTKKFDPGTKFRTAGWGVHANIFNPSGSPKGGLDNIWEADILQSKEVTLRPKDECTIKGLRDMIERHTPKLLPLFDSASKDSCYPYPPDENELCVSEGMQTGDAGAPLMKTMRQEGKDTYFTFGIATAKDMVGPVLYTDVSRYLGWILDNIQP